MKLEADGILGQGMTFSAEERERAIGTVHNIIHFHQSVSSSQIQQFSDHSSQILQSSVDVMKLTECLAKFRSALPELKLPAPERAEAEVKISTLEFQAESSKPEMGVVRESLKSLRTIVEGATGSLVASGIAAEIARLLGSGTVAF